MKNRRLKLFFTYAFVSVCLYYAQASYHSKKSLTLSTLSSAEASTGKGNMSAQEIERLEKTINKKLPAFYKQFLMNYPDDLIQLGAPYNTVSELSLPNKADLLIEISDFENAPANILVIGIDGLGNCYYLQLDNNDTKIYLFDHEAPSYLDEEGQKIDWRESWSQSYENLDEMIADLKERLKEE